MFNMQGIRNNESQDAFFIRQRESMITYLMKSLKNQQCNQQFTLVGNVKESTMDIGVVSETSISKQINKPKELTHVKFSPVRIV